TPDQAGVHTDSYTFVNGITEITDAIALQLGDTIRLNAEVDAVSGADDLYVVNYTDQDGINRFLCASLVVMAVPSPIASRIAAPVLDAERKELLAKIEFSPYITAALFSDAPIFTSAFDLSVPDGYFFTDIYDATWVRRHYDSAAGDVADGHVASVYIAPASYRDSELTGMTDNQILDRIFKDWREIFSGADTRYIAGDIEDMVTGHDIHRFTYAYPVMTEGSHARLKRLNTINTGDFLLAGDYLIYPTYEDAAVSGLAAAQKARDELERRRKVQGSEF
ncbi:MAG: FAD-dependent oxidoreductase, partial [Desulfobacterales bacterium]|nr:FAD-dependent oxidoreductase [Desulfobacterales bacterium]